MAQLSAEGRRVLDSAALFGEGGGECELLLVVANYTLPGCTAALWSRAAVRVAADGGANRLYDQLPLLLPQQSAEQARAATVLALERRAMLTREQHAVTRFAQVRKQFVPDLLAGDLDSVRPEVLAFYRERGCAVVDASHDQDTTDLHKCVALALTLAGERGQCQPHVVAVGALGGRLDHQLGALSLLHALPDTRLTLLGEHATATLLAPGRHLLRPHPATEGPVCGLVPLAGPAVVSSRGLLYDMCHTRLAMGHLVSTSNEIVAEEVLVDTDAPLVWTTELHSA